VVQYIITLAITNIMHKPFLSRGFFAQTSLKNNGRFYGFAVAAI
jgi:hypothetical protein